MDWAKLVAEVAVRQNRQAFDALFNHYAPRVKSLMMKNGASEELAEDIAQETLLAVWRKASQFDASTDGVAAWIFTIARNLRVDAIRKARNLIPLDNSSYGGWEDTLPTPDEVIQAQQDRKRVSRALAMLPVDQFQAIKGSYYEEKSHGEIAQALAIPLGTVKSRMRLAIERLRANLDNEE